MGWSTMFVVASSKTRPVRRSLFRVSFLFFSLLIGSEVMVIYKVPVTCCWVHLIVAPIKPVINNMAVATKGKEVAWYSV